MLTALFEKLFAKVNGNYENIAIGSVLESAKFLLGTYGYTFSAKDALSVNSEIDYCLG